MQSLSLLAFLFGELQKVAIYNIFICGRRVNCYEDSGSLKKDLWVALERFVDKPALIRLRQ